MREFHVEVVGKSDGTGSVSHSVALLEIKNHRVELNGKCHHHKK